MFNCFYVVERRDYEYILEGELPDSGPFFRDSLLIALLDYKILSIVVE